MDRFSMSRGWTDFRGVVGVGPTSKLETMTTAEEIERESRQIDLVFAIGDWKRALDALSDCDDSALLLTTAKATITQKIEELKREYETNE